MGSAQSKNVAEAVADISNYVSQTTNANSNQVTELSQSALFKDCEIKLKGDFKVDMMARIKQSSQQFVAAAQNSDVKNNIQQATMQAAKSRVGSMGVGFASASNNTSQFVNDSNQIINSMSTVANQLSNVNQNFQCDDSYIEANNLEINFDSTGDFLTTQTLKQEQVANISNDISQTIKQTASATVEGLAGFLIALAIVIAAIGYSLAKPLSSGAVKIVIAVVMVVLLTMILVTMYIRKTPPFFADPLECINNTDLGGCTDGCVDQKMGGINLALPPLRYIYALTPNDSPSEKGNLLQFVIARVAGTNGNNAGYNGSVAEAIDNRLNSYQTFGLSRLPPILVLARNSNGAMLKIPDAFIAVSSVAPGDQVTSSCTPNIAQVVPGSGMGPDGCNTRLDPSTLSTTENAGLAIANLNREGWAAYLSNSNPQPAPISPADNAEQRALYARFVLSDILGAADMHIYTEPDGQELVRYRDGEGRSVVGWARDAPKNTLYHFTPNEAVNTWSDGMSGGGVLHGLVGACNTRSYQFQKFMKKIGGWILLSIILLFLILTAVTIIRAKNKNEKQ